MASPGAGGVLLLDKPEGWTSTQALGRAKRILGLRKGGHTGTLDPFATGLLPLVFGEATKFSRFLIDAPKEYLAILRLGQTSTTGDPEGEVSAQIPVVVTSEQIDDVLATFMGVQSQVPPMHSALHHQGKRLYDFAREGVEVERAPRQIEVSALERVSNSGEKLIISVKCSKGTYVRTLAQDIGSRLGCGAYLTGLRRTGVAGFRLEQAITVEALGEAGDRSRECLLPAEVLVRGLPALRLDSTQAGDIEHGRAIVVAGHSGHGDLALFGPGDRFLGVGQAAVGDTVQPLRLLATAHDAKLPDFS